MQYQAILAAAAFFASATALPAPGQATCPDPAGKCPEPDPRPLEKGLIANPIFFDPSTAKKDATPLEPRGEPIGTIDFENVFAPYPPGFDSNTCHGFGNPIGPPLTPSTNKGPDKAKRSDLVKREYPELFLAGIGEACRWHYLQNNAKKLDAHGFDSNSFAVEQNSILVLTWAFAAAVKSIHIIADLGTHFEYRASVRVKSDTTLLSAGIWGFQFLAAGSYHLQVILEDQAKQALGGGIGFFQMSNTGPLEITPVRG